MAGPPRHLPFAFVADLVLPELDDATRHHLERVRRLRAGDGLTVGDGAGRYRLVRFGAGIEPAGDIVSEPAPEPAITIAFALVKGAKPELVVQKLTEVGADRIVPFVADRSVVRWDDAKTVRQEERLAVVAREAAAQSHRAWLPVVAPVTTFAEVAALPRAALAHPDGGALTAEHTTVLVGPEGGWSRAEEDAVTSRVRLGPHVLRAETAAIVAGGLSAALRAGVLDGS